jgi:hypothetical protein
MWSVTDFTVGGKSVPPLTADETRWQRLVFDNPGAATYQKITALPGLPATFTFDRPETGPPPPRWATASPASATFKEAFVGFSRC